MPLIELKPSPDFEKVIETCGGHGEKVEKPADLLPALERGFDAVRSGTPALLNVITQGRDPQRCRARKPFDYLSDPDQ